jgi:hypothetical protein
MDSDKRFYVYFHRRKDTGEVFYVGKGSGGRHRTPRRYKDWKLIMEQAGGFTSEIYRDNLSEADAFKLESEIIEARLDEWNLVNKRISALHIKRSKDELEALFEYDEQSPSCLTWKCWNRSRIHKTARFAGDIAGCVCKYNNGPDYYRVRVLGKAMLVHRIVWIMFNGDIPDNLVVNHIDNNSLNNRIDNLELVSKRENSQKTLNQKKEDAGVYLMTVGEHRYWVTNWTDLAGVRQCVLMSCLKLGEEGAYLAAKEKRKAELIKLNEQGASYII